MPTPEIETPPPTTIGFGLLVPVIHPNIVATGTFCAFAIA
jgi:hypothetical protein